MEKINLKISELQTKRLNFIKSIEPSNLKSEYLKCDGCGSRIRKDLFKGLCCPACGTTFISDTNKKRLATIEEKISKLKLSLKQEAHKPVKEGKHVIDLDNEKLIITPYTRTIDIGNECFMDKGFGIPLQSPCDKNKLLDKEKQFTNGNYPSILIEHEEEKYGNDTHGWNAYLNYPTMYGFELKYITMKECSCEQALQKVKKYIRANKETIQEYINFAEKS